MFALNHRCAELCIKNVQLRSDLFNMLVHSTTNYACEVWVDSKKIKAIEIMYWSFFKSLLRVRKTTSTSIVLAKFSKFPFERFAWARSLKTASWERHGKPNSLCLIGERNVGLDSWKNGYSRISPRRWQVFYFQFNRRLKWRLNLQRLVCSKRRLFNHCWEQLLGQRTYIRPI
jgi:hypothetical protein